MAESDEQIGRNVQTLRGDMTQKELADAMKARGYKWSQPTVVAIEKGERPLRLTEARDLAEILNSNVLIMTMPEVQLGLVQDFRAISAVMEEIESAARDLFAKQRRLAIAADHLGDEFTDEHFDAYLGRTAMDAALEGTIVAEAQSRATQEANDLIDGKPNTLPDNFTNYASYMEQIRGLIARRHYGEHPPAL